MGKMRDLWSAEGRTKAVNTPQPVPVARGWTLDPESVPTSKLGPRKRKYVHAKPNKRAAVALPVDGQSYNPSDESHQEALRTVVKQLEKKKRQHDRFVKKMTVGRDTAYRGNLGSDKTWEEEVMEHPPPAKKAKRQPLVAAVAATKKVDASRSRGSASVPAVRATKPGPKEAVKGVPQEAVKGVPQEAATATVKKAAKKAKKMNKLEAERARKKAHLHRRHPHRSVVAKEADDLDTLLEKHSKTMAERTKRCARKRQAVKEGQTIRSFGRYHHQPLALDVAPSSKLVGSLRHLSGSFVHPAMDRLKSFEERNLVPARMAHAFNKRKILKPKGQVRVKREDFGILPQTDF